MAINSEKNYYIHPKALSFTPNYQGHRNIVYVSIVSNAAIKVYHKDVAGLGYGLDAEYQTWRLTATTTALGTASAYIIYACLSRIQQTADIIFSVRDYSVEGGYAYTDSEGNEQTVAASDTYYYIKIGTITATDAAGDDATIDRILTYVSGELGTDKQINEQSDSVFEQMFEFVTDGVTKLIRVKETFESIKVSGEAIFNSIVKFVKGFTIGENTITNIATSEDELTPDDSTLPTTGYVAREIEALDAHFLIKNNPDTEQSVTGPVTFEQDVAVQGDHTIGGNQTIQGTQEVKGVQTLHQGFQTTNFIQQGDIIQGAQVDGDGNAAFASITAPVMQIYELQYNRKTAVQEEFIFSDGDTVETVTYVQADGTEIDSTAYNGEEYSYIRLGIRKQYEGYMTTFKDEDVLYSNVNIIGESGQPATTGKCWMRVLALGNDLGVDPISTDGLFINAILYSEAQCPANINMEPTPHMVISRHGNANGTLHPDRQSVFIISTAAENMVQLRGISSPIIPDTGAYAIVSGKLPSTLYEKVHEAASYISENDPVSYARYGIFENFIQLDHEGLPIKTERYRGEWKESIATDTELDESGMYVNRYKNTATTYDTVTHNGSLWACQVSDTTIPPSDNVTEWLCVVSKGYGAIQYDLIPKPNIIYLRGSVLSTNELNAEVLKTSSEGVVKLSQQIDLEAEGLEVQWAIDGGERNDLTIGDETVLVLDDDGTALDVADTADATDTVLYLEGEAIDVSTISDNITLYLVDTESGEDIQKKVIPVVKDGADGKPVYVSPSMSSLVVKTAEHTENDGTTTVKTTEAIDSTIYCTLIYNDEPIADITDVSVSGYGAEADEVKTDGQVVITVTIPIGTLLANLSTEIVVTLTGLDVSGVEHKASVAIPVIPAMRGLAGPMGESGYFYYPAGEWDSAVAGSDEGYAVDTNTQSAPFVYYDGLYYYRTTNELNYNSDGVLYTPAEDVANASNPAWRVIPEYKAIYTKILMANWAQLGKAVFWGDYMFSQKGILTGSTGMTDYVEDMFDEDGRLNGTFVPNLFLDFNTGAVKLNKLSESFARIANNSPLHRMDMNATHNVSTCYRDFYPLVITLPSTNEEANNKWSEDGTRCTIAYDYWHEYNQGSAVAIGHADNVIAVCADDRFLNYSDEDYYSTLAGMASESNGWMIWKGRRCKFVLLAPGTMLTLRSLKTEEDGIIWFIENSGDFERLNIYDDGNSAKIMVYQNSTNEDTPIEIYNSTESPAGSQYGTLIGSTSLTWFSVAPQWDFIAKGIEDENGDVTAYMYANYNG